MNVPQGFKYAGIAAGLKSKGKKDIGLIISEVPAVCAGVFTQNQVAAACVKYSQKIVKKGLAKSIIVNTKNANAATGKQGGKNNQEIAKIISKLYGGPTLTASTGVIGQQLPMSKIKAALPKLKSKLKNNYDDFAQAILTTDLTVKKISKKIKIKGKVITVSGVAKGSGMIHPNMATMLGFITTDARITKSELQKIIKSSANKSFNQITVDGDTSTNDMVLCLANGISNASVDSKTKVFVKAFEEVCIYLAKEIARDGEGATKLMEVTVKGARSKQDAGQIAKTIAGSPLVKCAVYGEDDNWGRVIAAVGRAGIKIIPEKVKMKWTGLKTKTVNINVDLGLGKYNGTAWGCDLTEGYIKINTKYN